MYVHHVEQCLSKLKEVPDTPEMELPRIMSHHAGAEPNPSPLHEQQVLLPTQPSL